ncbi:hypothetical protein ABPG75_001964 [Micractinium tetrahymenae]
MASMARQDRRRTALVLCLLTALALSGPGCSARHLAADTVDGTAVLMINHEHEQPERLLAVRLGSGRLVRVLSDAEQQAAVSTGMRVRLTGSWEATPGAAESALFRANSIQAFPGGAAARAAGGAAAHRTRVTTAGIAGVAGDGIVVTSNVPVAAISTLFIPVAALDAASAGACPGAEEPPLTADQLRAVVFEQEAVREVDGSKAGLGPAPPSVGSLFSQCSYGKSRLTPADSMVAETVELPCNGSSYGIPWSFDSCDFDDYNGWADAADERLRAAGVDPDAYQHRVYLLPPGACTFMGVAYLGCEGSGGGPCRSWVAAGNWDKPQAIAHGLAHNMFLAHAGRILDDGTFDAFADSSCTMARFQDATQRCFNTPHAWQLGWISAQLLDGASLAPGQTVSASLLSQASSDRTGLRILPSWAPGTAPVFVGYRTAQGGDAGLAPLWDGKVSVHSAAIDSALSTSPTVLRAALAVGEAYTFNEAGLVVRFVDSGADTSAHVSVCRVAGPETLASCRAGMDADCNGLAADQDPACRKLFRKFVFMVPTAGGKKRPTRPPLVRRRAGARRQGAP